MSPPGDVVAAMYAGDVVVPIIAANYGEAYGDTKGWMVTISDGVQLPIEYTDQKVFYVKNLS